MQRCVKCDRPVESRKPLGRGHATEKVCEPCAENILVSLGLCLERQPTGEVRIAGEQLQLSL